MDSLLSREIITLDSSNIRQYIHSKRILITGAAGSIGSELLRQIMSFAPKQVMAIDQSEIGIYSLQGAMNVHPLVTCQIANITDKESMEHIFHSFNPQVVFHAAAYKHVCLLETQPEIAVKNNIIGTKILADIAISTQVEKFIFVSTDKAVNPIGIMGISKRLSELYLLALNQRNSRTQFVTTRFGNVLGSSGSVFHVFKNCIKKNLPIPISHPDTTRYMMAIPEAVQLVLESAAIGGGGEIMIFNMGEPIVIIELAKRMHRHFHPGKCLPEILIVGLKPGEKLHEELQHDYEKVIHEHQQKMRIIKPNLQELPNAFHNIDEINKALTSVPVPQLSKYLKQLL